MADKSFGVKELNLLNASGTPTITSPNNLNLNANTVAISTSVTIGHNLTVSANAGIASLNVTGIATVNNFKVAGVSTFVGLTTFTDDIYIVGNHLVSINDSLTLRGSNGGNSFISNYIDTSGGAAGDLYISNISGKVEIDTSEHFSVKTNTNEQAILATQNGSVALYHDGGNKKLETTTNGIDVTGAITVNGSATSAWTISNNGSSNYVISGPGGLSSANNPDLYLERGQTYQFIMNAAGHGFGIQTSSGTWNSSNAYTTGITNAAAATGVITFQVPYSAPDRLYYACTSGHSGMVGNIYILGGSTDIKMADQWRITAVHPVPTQNSVISSNWERVDGTAQGTLGTGMSQSSGVFTFPYTGIYLVRFQGYFEENTSTNQAQVEMRASNDGGSSYSTVAYSVCSIPNLSTYTYSNIQMESLIDVTNVSNVKVFWQSYSATATALDGSSTQNRTYATFLRLGDT